MHMELAIASASKGGKVAIFTENLQRADMLAHDAEEITPNESVEKVTRANGRRALHFHGGGSIRFISVNQSARGLSLDRAFLPRGTSEDVRAAIIPALATSREAAFPGYY
jgi:hypothetical protein